MSTDGKEYTIISYDGSGSMKAIMDNLTEDNHSFLIVRYDDKGNASSQTKIVGRVYGDSFIQSIESRDIRDAIYDNGTIKIAWGAPEESMMNTDIKYVNISRGTLHVSLSASEDSSFLTDHQPDTYFSYRTMNKPAPDAIDSFYAAYTSSKKWSTFSNLLFNDRGADP